MSFDPITYALAKNYSDSKGGYTEPGKVLFNLKLTDMGGGFSVGEASESTPTPTFEVGKTYTVKTDSGTITVKAKWYEVGGAPYLGDIGLLFGNADTGEGFVVADMPNDGGYSLVVMDVNNGTSCTVSTASTTVPIKPEYLPGVCLPVVELSTALTEEGAPLTTEESAKLTDAASRKLPCVIVASYHDEAIGQTVGESFDAMYSNAEGLDTFFYNSMYYSYVFVCEEGAWVGTKAPLG